MKTISTRAALAGVAAAMLVAAPALADVKIGSLGAITGPIVSLVKEINLAEQAAIDEINAGGGINGDKAVIVFGDTGCNSQTAVDAANKLVNIEQVVGIAGALCSGATIPAASNVAVPAGVVMISPASTSPEITNLKDNDYLYRTAPSDAFQGGVLAKLVLSKGIKKVALTYINNDYGVGLAGTFRSTYKALGGIITADQVHEEKKQSYRSELASLASGGSTKLVLIAMGEGSGMTMIRQSLEGGMFDTFIGADGMHTDKMVEGLGADNVRGKLWGTLPSAKPSKQLDNFKAMYGDGKKFKFGSPFTAQGYDAVMLVALAAQMAGSSDRTAIRDNLRKVSNAPGMIVGPGQWAEAVAAIKAGKDINYEGASGSHEFDAKGEVAGVFAEYQVEGNKLVDSAPLDLK
ncbi:MAG: ABC transporter substrate-binding protein [Alphaproteobacteria bacterium]|jgi:branched-chain amino acid transport system substrate-binding protein|nr:ABC transporter substrate-binding protein [Alphaproteobacteria bacterium]MBT4017858.1 ABC transporter substrate-binding protein [Alphaproteobacteria bacterium]MBT4965209.1 ABC transporter substrate-binding protein [Alphaproteobacteria bacterium]MBT5159694.1 ABC transporter substrate-binding protein [Alphaproteobacteria bacterium]MBT6384588.1 ABC transporter substrate-binding protein [Alphaproteobacteria bacterium]